MAGRLSRGETALLLTFALFMADLAFLGRSPGYPPPKTYPYPVFAVTITAIVMGAEVTIFWAILRPRSYRRSWQRSALASVLFLSWALFCIPMVMHAPGYVVVHTMWAVLLGLVALSVFTISLASIAIEAVAKRRG